MHIDIDSSNYFIPTPTEIHIGMFYDEFHRGKWITKKIEDINDLIRIFKFLDKGRVRTALLNDKTLYEEGWLLSNGQYTKGNFSLVQGVDKLEIFYKGNRVFSGKCKGVNSFITICIFLKV